MSEKDDPLSLARALADAGSEVITEILSLGLQAKRARDGGAKKGSHLHQVSLPDSLWAFIQKEARSRGTTPSDWLADAAYSYIFKASEDQ
ncbi:MAG: hypothetical protein IKS61_01075 [Aeriscardovia sp.]|nr:hypothetical protein [Aeriscardovia sp.]